MKPPKNYKYTLAAALDYAKKGWPDLPLYEVNSGSKYSCGKAECGSPSIAL